MELYMKRSFDELINLVHIGQNKDFQFEQRKEALLLFEKQYISLSRQEKKVLEVYLYLTYRELGALFYTTNINAEDCNHYFESSLSIVSNGDYDSPINISISKSMLCKSLILTGLKNNNEDDICKARRYFEEAKELLMHDERSDLRESVDKLENIFKAVEENNIWSNINFEIGYYIDMPQETEFEFVYETVKCKVKSKHIPETNKIKGNAFIYNSNDKYGLLNHSKITVSINDFIEPTLKENVNRESKDVWCSISRAVEVWNYFIKNYRVSTKEYWLENINEFMILNYDTQINAGKVELQNVPLSYSMGLQISTNVPCINETTQTELSQMLKNGTIDLWQTAYLDSLKQLQIRNYKESIIQVNIALENYLYTVAKKVLNENIGEDATQDFLQGEVRYEDFYLNQYISAELFNKMVSDGVIKSNPPTTYAIIKRCYEFLDRCISKRSLMSKISIVRKYRNDIVHGNDIKCNIKREAENAIGAFEDLIKILT